MTEEDLDLMENFMHDLVELCRGYGLCLCQNEVTRVPNLFDPIGHIQDVYGDNCEGYWTSPDGGSLHRVNTRPPTPQVPPEMDEMEMWQEEDLRAAGYRPRKAGETVLNSDLHAAVKADGVFGYWSGREHEVLSYEADGLLYWTKDSEE